ncbi:MAG: UvrB/UvrC motif-containing protein, partial [Desulfatiglandales bacterium]
DAAGRLDFEEATRLRDQISYLEKRELSRRDSSLF